MRDIFDDEKQEHIKKRIAKKKKKKEKKCDNVGDSEKGQLSKYKEKSYA